MRQVTNVAEPACSDALHRFRCERLGLKKKDSNARVESRLEYANYCILRLLLVKLPSSAARPNTIALMKVRINKLLVERAAAFV
jgi:hypothetical protein